MEQSSKESQVLPQHQVRAHIQAILAQPFDTDLQSTTTSSSTLPLSRRFTTAVHTIRDPIQDS